VAATGGYSGKDPIGYVLNLLKEYLLKAESKNISAGEHTWVPSAPTAPAGDASLSGSNEPIEQQGQVLLIRPFCRAVADYCLECERQARSAGGVVKAISRSATGGDPRVTCWEDVEITFLSDERIEVRIAGRRQTYNYAEFGCKDKRSGKPLEIWGMLRVLAQNEGLIPSSARHKIRECLLRRSGFKDLEDCCASTSASKQIACPLKRARDTDCAAKLGLLPRSTNRVSQLSTSRSVGATSLQSLFP